MSEVIDRPAASDDGKIVLDGEFLREQAKEAVGTFFSPLLGIYAAAKGGRVIFRRAKRGKRAA